MRKKDYELIAKSVFSSFADFEDFGLNSYNAEDQDEMLEHVCNNLAQALGAEHPKFDRHQFLAACGIGCMHLNKNTNAYGVWCLDCGTKIKQ